MRRARPFVLVAALAALGCSSGGDGTPDSGTPAGPDDAYFGLADRKCLRFTSGGGLNDFTLEMVLDNTTITGVRTYHVTTKMNGLRQEELWFEVTEDSMLLHRRRAVEDNKDSFWIFTPGATWLKKDIELGASADSNVTAKVSGVRSGSFPTTFNVVALTQDTLTAGGQSVDATKYTITRTEEGQNPVIDKVWFAPNTGIVKLDPAGTAIGEVTLVSSSILGSAETCE